MRGRRARYEVKQRTDYIEEKRFRRRDQDRRIGGRSKGKRTFVKKRREIKEEEKTQVKWIGHRKGERRGNEEKGEDPKN